MPKLAKTIDIKRTGNRVALTIDGEEFRWYLADEPLTTTTEARNLGTVNLTLIAERVTIDDDLGAPVGPASSDIDCRNHQPRQHRDGKPPWCNECGLTESGEEPQSHVTITVDGEDTVIRAGRRGAAFVLGTVGLNAALYDLQRVQPDGSSATVRGDIVLADGDEFVTARISAGT
jgi:hypothetical protein